MIIRADNMKRLIISDISEIITEKVKQMGFQIIRTIHYKNNYDNIESTHADMQALRVGDDIFLIKSNDYLNRQIISCFNGKAFFTKDEILDFSYPQCVKLNVAIVGKNAIGNFKYSDPNLLEYLQKNDYNMINVNQGYSKCSVCVVSENAIITSDSGIAKSAEKNNIDVLKISPGNIQLCEKYGGFIGGASFLKSRSELVFFGNIDTHPDSKNIRDFCQSHEVKVINLTNEKLLDIGGVVSFR